MIQISKIIIIRKDKIILLNKKLYYFFSNVPKKIKFNSIINYIDINQSIKAGLNMRVKLISLIILIQCVSTC